MGLFIAASSFQLSGQETDSVRQENTAEQERAVKQETTVQQERTVKQQTAAKQESKKRKTANNLSQHFEQLKEETSQWQEYQMIKVPRLNRFWKVVEDSVENFRQEINERDERLKAQAARIDELEAKAAAQSEAIESLKEQISSIEVLGINFQKPTFVSIAALIILGLLVLAGFLFISFKSSYRLTAQSKRDYDHLFNEFEEFRKRTREKEVKLKRELQTERNTLEEIKQKMPGRM